MEEYHLNIANEHLIFDQAGHQFLIDTGSRSSFGRSDLTLEGTTYQLHETECSLQHLNESSLFHGEIDGLIGTDILEGHIITIFKKEQKIVFGECNCTFSNALPCHTNDGFIFCNLTVNHQPCKALIDTGAYISYAQPCLLKNVTTTEKIEDYNPYSGIIKTDGYDVEVTIGHSTSRIRVAKTIDYVDHLLSAHEAHYLFGCSVIPANVIQLDLRNRTLSF